MPARTKIGNYDVQQPSVVAGVVRYQATHVVLPRRAIIEVLAPTAPRTAAIRLMRHACILEALQHAGVPRVFECGLLEGRPWVAFEHIEGISLESELRSRRLGVSEVLDVIEHVATILTHAHARGVLHRDITPRAIIRDARRGQAVLQGWASACTLDTEAPSVLKGTHRYRAPELVGDRRADGRADVFALGRIAYEALTGRAPFHTGLAALIAEMVSEDPTLRPTASDVVETIRALRAGADADYASLKVALEAAARLDDDDEIDIVFDEVDDEPPRAEQPRATSRWTPQWGLDARAVVAHGIVEIMPRRRAADDDR